MSNWFIASEKESPLISKLEYQMSLFWRQNNFNTKNNIIKSNLKKILKFILNSNEKTTRYWFLPIIIKVFKIYPDYIFHYMFEQLIYKDQECKNIWEKTIKISAEKAHRIQDYGFFSNINDSIKKEIDSKQTPLYKLTWKYNHTNYLPSTLLYYLLEDNIK
jgi:hypothetical protein